MSILTEYSLKLQDAFPKWRRWRMKKYWYKQKKRYTDSSLLLSYMQRKELRSFWYKYIKISDLFHRFYTQKTGSFSVDYLPDDVYSLYIDPFFNNGQLAKWLDDKTLYSSILADPLETVKQPEMVCMRSGGYWITPQFTPIKYCDAKSLIFSDMCRGGVFVKKSIDSYGGMGVHYFNTDCRSESEFDKLVDEMGDNLVIQKKINQCDVLSSLNPSSVNTLRLLSFLTKEGEVKIYSVVLRMGINGAVVDNASSGGITVGVNDDGRLKNVAYTAHGVRFERVHPDSKIEFASIVIPRYDEIKEAVKRLHYRLPRLRMLSWDFAIDKENHPILIEVNMNRGELDFHQLNNGPLFGDDTEKILDEVFHK